MPQTDVILYQQKPGDVPMNDWLGGLSKKQRAKCGVFLERLGEFGSELRRPAVEYLEGTDLYELRVKVFKVHLRMLYFFHGRDAVVVSHGFAKEGKIPPGEIRLATTHMERFKKNPKLHTYNPQE